MGQQGVFILFLIVGGWKVQISFNGSLKCFSQQSNTVYPWFFFFFFFFDGHCSHISLDLLDLIRSKQGVFSDIYTRAGTDPCYWYPDNL